MASVNPTSDCAINFLWLVLRTLLFDSGLHLFWIGGGMLIFTVGAYYIVYFWLFCLRLSVAALFLLVSVIYSCKCGLIKILVAIKSHKDIFSRISLQLLDSL